MIVIKVILSVVNLIVAFFTFRECVCDGKKSSGKDKDASYRVAALLFTIAFLGNIYMIAN